MPAPAASDDPQDPAPRGSPARGARAEPWYVAAFRADYRRVYAHRDHAAARREVAHLASHGVQSPILDLCAGFGRHTLAFRERGERAFGLDLSLDLLRAAEAAELAGRMLCADVRRLPFADGAFRTVAMLFSSFGYFDDDANRAVLAEVARVLAVGGRAVFDLMNPERIRRTLVERSRREEEGYVLVEERRLADGGRRVVKDVVLVDAAGERSWSEDVRMYAPAEFDALCRAAGLVVESREGDFGARPFDAAAPRQIVWTRRESGPRA
jgi:SAM-dependent methyltransferase